MMTQVLKFQTLQDISSPITPPYDRSPQIVARYNTWDLTGFDVGVTADTTRFEADYSRIPGGTSSILRNGQRSFAAAQISRPWLKPWGFVIPKIQLHATRYQLDSALANGQLEANRLLPTFSLDTGLVYERDASILGRGLRQTLEPRAFFVRTPYKDQSQLPSYDSGATDFNLTTVYSENPYVGQDRLADNNLVTLGVNSRFFDSNTGRRAGALWFCSAVSLLGSTGQVARRDACVLWLQRYFAGCGCPLGQPLDLRLKLAIRCTNPPHNTHHAKHSL